MTFGSEHIREAVCRLIECLATTNLPVYDYQHKSTLATWKDVVDSSLERKEENVRDHAVAAYGALAATYGIEESEVKSCLEKIGTSRHLYGRRGYAIALGTLNYSIPERRSWLPDVLRQLCMASRVQVCSLVAEEVIDNCLIFLVYSKSNKQMMQKPNGMRLRD